jgi:hypothetical protein
MKTHSKLGRDGALRRPRRSATVPVAASPAVPGTVEPYARWAASALLRPGRSHSGNCAAFTLIEVMIAMGIFFMAIFAILGLVSSNLRNARRLQQKPVDASALIAELSLTNKLTAGSDHGDFSDYGDLYKGYRWDSEITEVRTNGLFQVEYMVTGPSSGGQTPPQTHLTVLLWRPLSTPGTPVPGGR